MSTYQDKYGRYHHKLCVGGEPSSNNGWIYTAYAGKLGLELPTKSILPMCFNACSEDGVLIRSPGKPLPVISRDEVLGMTALGYLQPSHLDGWNFSPFPLPRLNPIKLIQQLIEVRGKHRNYFWENNLDQLYRFAFSVPLVDRHFILSKWGKFNPIYWAIAKIDSMSSSKSGIRWLKYGKSLDAMQEEFPEDHPFRKVHYTTFFKGLK